MVRLAKRIKRLLQIIHVRASSLFGKENFVFTLSEKLGNFAFRIVEVAEGTRTCWAALNTGGHVALTDAEVAHDALLDRIFLVVRSLLMTYRPVERRNRVTFDVGTNARVGACVDAVTASDALLGLCQLHGGISFLVESGFRKGQDLLRTCRDAEAAALADFLSKG